MHAWAYDPPPARVTTADENATTPDAPASANAAARLALPRDIAAVFTGGRWVDLRRDQVRRWRHTAGDDPALLRLCAAVADDWYDTRYAFGIRERIRALDSSYRHPEGLPDTPLLSVARPAGELADGRDGLTEAQRATLFALWRLGAFFDKPCAPVRAVAAAVRERREESWSRLSEAELQAALVQLGSTCTRTPLVESAGRAALDSESVRHASVRLTALGEEVLATHARDLADQLGLRAAPRHRSDGNNRARTHPRRVPRRPAAEEPGHRRTARR